MKCFLKYLISFLICTVAIVFIQPQSVYAKILDDNDIKNLIANVSMKQNGTSDISQGLRDYLNQNETMISYVRSKLNENEGKYIISQTDDSTIRFWYYTNSNQKAYIYRNSVNINTSYTNSYAIRFNFNNNIGFLENDFYSIGNIDILTKNTFYTDTNIYSNGSYSNITYTAGSTRPADFDIFNDFIYKNDYFSFIPNSSLGLVNIDFINDLVYEVTPSDYNNFMCSIGLKENLGNIIFNQYYYDNDVGDFLNFRNVNGYDFYNDDSNLVYLYLKEAYDIKNTLILFVIQPDFTLGKDYSSLYFYCYLSDNNTVITDGNLDVSDTFKGSYYNDYLNRIKSVSSGGAIYNNSGDVTGFIDLDPIKNSINDINNTLTDDSQVDNILNVIPSTSGDMALEMGYSSIDNPFTTFLYNIILGISNTLLDHQPVTLSFQYRGTEYNFSSNDFTVPNGALKTLVTTLLVFLYIFISYKYYNHLIASLQKADINSLKKELGNDEFMDTNTM